MCELDGFAGSCAVGDKSEQENVACDRCRVVDVPSGKLGLEDARANQGLELLLGRSAALVFLVAAFKRTMRLLQQRVDRVSDGNHAKYCTHAVSVTDSPLVACDAHGLVRISDSGLKMEAFRERDEPSMQGCLERPGTEDRYSWRRLKSALLNSLWNSDTRPRGSLGPLTCFFTVKSTGCSTAMTMTRSGAIFRRFRTRRHSLRTQTIGRGASAPDNVTPKGKVVNGVVAMRAPVHDRITALTSLGQKIRSEPSRPPNRKRRISRCSRQLLVRGKRALIFDWPGSPQHLSL